MKAGIRIGNPKNAKSLLQAHLTSPMMWRGVRPRTWYERSKARQSTRLAGLFWGALLVMLLIIVIARHRMLA